MAGTAKDTKSRMAQKGCEGQKGAKHNTLCCLMGAALQVVEYGCFTPMPDTEMGWEAEKSAVGEL